MSSKKTPILVTVFIAATLFYGCTSNSQSTNKVFYPDIPVQKLNFLEAEYYTLFWSPYNNLLGTVLDETDGLFYLSLEEQEKLEKISVSFDPACDRYLYYLPIKLLSDSRLGLIKHCGKNTVISEPDSSLLMSYNIRNNTLEQIVDGDLPGGNFPAGFSWNPTMTYGVQELTDRLFSTLYWISPEGSLPIPLTLKDGYRSWSLEEQYNNMISSNEGGSKYGYAGYPAWSPDGKKIAFWASFDAIGHKGITRVDGEFYLVFLNPQDLSYRFILRDIYNPYELEWSPDGKWLAFFGSVGISEKGFWLYSATKNSILKIGDIQHFSGAPAWSPDSQSVAVISCYAWNTEICKKTEILKYDLIGVAP